MRGFSYLARVCRRHPTYFLIVTGVLALGIGATTAVFSIVRGVILRPLPLPEPDRVVTLWESDPRSGYPKFRVAAGNFTDWQALNCTCSSMALFGGATFQVDAAAVLKES